MANEIATADDIAEMKEIILGLQSEMQTLTHAFKAQQQDQMPEWVTVKEAAKYLRVKDSTVRTKVKKGQFDILREGKSILISREFLLNQSSLCASSSLVSL